MQHYEPVSFCHKYDPLTFKIIMLLLVSNKEQLKHLLLLYKCLTSLAITGNTFHHFYTYDTPTFKTEALRLVSNEGRVKYFLLQWLI